MRQLLVTKCDSFLLQSVTILLQILKCDKFTTKCDKFTTKCDGDYKVRKYARDHVMFHPHEEKLTQSQPKFTGSFTKTVYITKTRVAFVRVVQFILIFITSLPSRVAANTTGGGSYDKQMAT